VQGREITITTEMGTVEPDRALTNANGERSVRRDDMELRFGFSVHCAAAEVHSNLLDEDQI
jgi:hypothetical protein